MSDINKTIDADIVYTGYFARMKDYISIGFKRFIRVSLYNPKFVYSSNLIKPCTDILVKGKDGNIKPLELYPDKDTLLLIKRDENYSEYMINYSHQLELFDPLSVYEELKGSILLCYEKYGDFCHRNLISFWLNSNGYKSCEYIIPNDFRDSSNNNSKNIMSKEIFEM